jgi:capsular polysaccharide biosynthesis protein
MTERRVPPFCLAEEQLAAFWAQVPFYQHGLEHDVQPAFLAGLCNASVLSGGTVVRSSDNFLFYEPFHVPKHVWQSGLSRLLLPPIDLDLRGDYIHLGLLWATAHYHWVFDVLPRLSIIERFDHLRDKSFILPAGVTSCQRESLHMLGVRPDRLVEFAGSHWRVERLYYPSTLGLSGNPTSLAVQWLRKHFVSDYSRPTKRLYVSRKDDKRRRITNEDALVNELLQFGFEVVCPAEMSFSDQVRLFSQARTILGPHGGGLTNSVFAPPSTTFLEVFPPEYINGCFWALANACGHKYGFTIGKQRGEDIEVDVSNVLRLLISMDTKET